MPLSVTNEVRQAPINNPNNGYTAASDIPTEVKIAERINAFFSPTHQAEALDCLRDICHPPAARAGEYVSERFERLREFAEPGYQENIQSGRHGGNDFVILDKSSQQILLVKTDEAGGYTVEFDGHLTSHAAATTAPPTAKDYEAIWSRWVMGEDVDERGARAEVKKRVDACLSGSSETLNLQCLDITSLPDGLPPGIKELCIDSPRLTSLPALPAGLQVLIVSYTPLTSLLPLPAGLQVLIVSYTPLTSLLPLPAGLRLLDISHTPLTSLPPLPAGLRLLDINHTPLTSLPPLPAGLRELNARNTLLTHLPESIDGLSANADVYLFNTPLSERTLQALRTITSEPGYSGPRIAFDMGTTSGHPEARALHLAVADWLIPAKQGEAPNADRWQAFGQEDDAASFSSFLDRMRDTENFKKNSGFKAQVSSWLTQLAEDDGLRAKTFAMAMKSTSSCEDRVTLAMNNMRNVQLVHDTEKGVFDKKLPELVSVGREMFRLEKLEQIARGKVITLRFVDEIEVYLGYQNRLRGPLELTSVTEDMRFFDVSGITEADLAAAEIQVKTAEDSQFMVRRLNRSF